MNIESLPIVGAYVVGTDELTDDRGFFARTFSEDAFREAGLATQYPEHSVAYNAVAGTVRGMHYSALPAQEYKLVRCERGAILDVILDVRPESATYGLAAAVELSQKRVRSVYVPAGCAHGYQTLVDDSVVSYLISERYIPELSRGYSIYSEAVRGLWKLPVSSLSARDKQFDAFSV